MAKKILHIVSQDDQPIGSRNKSCDECGVYIGNLGDDDSYTEKISNFTKEVAEKNNLTRCTDK